MRQKTSPVKEFKKIFDLIQDVNARYENLRVLALKDSSRFEPEVIEFSRKLSKTKLKIKEFMTRYKTCPVEMNVQEGTLQIGFENLDNRGLYTASAWVNPVKVHPLLLEEIFSSIAETQTMARELHKLGRKHVSKSEPSLMSPSEASKTLGVSYKTLWRWWREGKIEAKRLPSRRLRYSRSEIERILQKKSGPEGNKRTQ